MHKLSNRKGLLKHKLNTDVFSVAINPGSLLSNVMTSKDSGVVQLGKALEREYLHPDPADQRTVGGNEYLNVFKNDKEYLINTSYMWTVKLLGRLLIVDAADNPGPANFLNVAGIGADQAVVAAGDNVAGTSLSNANQSRILKKILHKFGNFKVKEALAVTVGNSIEWLESKCKSIAGIDIPAQVIEKKKKPL